MKRAEERTTIVPPAMVISGGDCHAMALCTRGASSSRESSVRNTGSSNIAS
jgi:hypothetical protein